ncbi:hypothetical protein Q73A0000_10005 [Kaistella flava (ex Peng et al. 2021)]|uniref:Uncharacterized protein n=1 Tax=Kaistella flava (ex Peng et al. 2021) TaxID=2038776 RepID=A0A7M2YBE3_9FLAO|nr:hypothetical protein [Kaistella flava (ex Peng et al. 2021)]QOW10683.1 hypothetical protein Q73A0000_10005 [Kaistella flava (ex Peng et al. 2021)]
MKNICYLVLLLPAFAFSQESINISADLRGRSCSGGSGICSVGNSSDSKFATEVLVKKIGKSEVAFIIKKPNLNSETQRSIAGKEFAKISANEIPQFHQEKDLFLDKETLEKLEMDPKFLVIKEGFYPLQFDDQNITISFTLTEL